MEAMKASIESLGLDINVALACLTVVVSTLIYGESPPEEPPLDGLGRDLAAEFSSPNVVTISAMGDRPLCQLASAPTPCWRSADLQHR